MSDELRLGIYQHYKGPLYQVIGLAHDANDETRKCVVYMPLQLDGAHLGPRMAVRSRENFTDLVDAKDGCNKYGLGPTHFTATEWPEHRDHIVPRFAYVGAELTADLVSAVSP